MKTILALSMFLTSLASPFAYAEGVSERVAEKRLELAAVLIEALDSNNVCDAEAYPSEINRLVKTAWYSASEPVKDQFLRNTMRSSIRADLAFREAIQSFSAWDRDQSLEKVQAALVGTKYFHFGQGAYGSGYNVVLKADGTAKEMTLELLEQEPWYRWVPSTTTWSVRKEMGQEGFPFLLKVGTEEFRLDTQTEGELLWIPTDTQKDQPKYYEKTLSSSDSFCDA